MEKERVPFPTGHGSVLITASFFHKAWVECVHLSVRLSVALPPDKLMHIRFVFDYLELMWWIPPVWFLLPPEDGSKGFPPCQKRPMNSNRRRNKRCVPQSLLFSSPTLIIISNNIMIYFENIVLILYTSNQSHRCRHTKLWAPHHLGYSVKQIKSFNARTHAPFLLAVAWKTNINPDTHTRTDTYKHFGRFTENWLKNNTSM